MTPLIAHTVFRFDFGGLENGIVNLVNRLPVSAYRHAIVCLEGFNPAYARRITRADVEIVSIDKRPGKDPAAYWRLWQVLRRLRPSIVHTRNLGTLDTQWVAAAAGVPARIHGEHGWSPTDPQGLDPGNLRLRRACRPAVHRYVAMSRDIERWLTGHVGVPPRHVRQIYNGVDAAKFRPDGPRAADLPWQAPARDATIVIGTVGRLDPIKNHAALIDAFDRLLQRRPDARGRLRLAIVGDGPEMTRLRTQVADRALGDVVWLAGARHDTAELLRAFDVFVLPSINEGISNTILEAMATGLPLVASRVGGNPELVLDGVTGRLYAPEAPGALEEALLACVDDADLRASQGRAGRARAIKEFSLEAMVDAYRELYDELLQSPAVPVLAGDRRGEGT